MDRSKVQTYASLERGDVVNEAFRNDRCRKTVLLAFIVLLILSILLFMTIYVVMPVAFMYSLPLERLVVFTNFHQPSEHEMFEKNESGWRNIYVPVTDDSSSDGTTISLGVWHIMPDVNATVGSLKEHAGDFDYALENGKHDVLIHFHGSGETRLDVVHTLYLLRKWFHVISFDYRGYGDSDKGTMSEEAIISDCVQLYRWVRRKTERRIYLWGHSLGAAIATRTAATLADLPMSFHHVGAREEERRAALPAGLVLESPFTSLREEIPLHPYGKQFSWLPWFNATVLNPLREHGFLFDNAKNIVNVDCPIMVLHAEDDSIIPYTLGKELYMIAKHSRKHHQGSVVYHQFPASEGLDHFWMYESPELPAYIENFTDICNTYSKDAVVQST